jgi:hypothetical protein
LQKADAELLSIPQVVDLNWRVRAVTDANGEYALPALPAGTHTVLFSAGDSLETQSVDVVAGETVTLDRQVAGAPTLVMRAFLADLADAHSKRRSARKVAQ